MPQIPDDERDVTVRRVQEAFAAGHLSQEELDTRIERALTAGTRGELASVLSDLPEPPDHLADRPIVVKSHAGRFIRRGGWHAPSSIKIESVYGGVTLDFTKAVITSATVDVDLRLKYGSAKIIVPPDARVDVDGVTTQWSTSTYTPPSDTGPPSVRIRITGHLGYGKIRIRHRGGRRFRFG